MANVVSLGSGAARVCLLVAIASLGCDLDYAGLGGVQKVVLPTETRARRTPGPTRPDPDAAPVPSADPPPAPSDNPDAGAPPPVTEMTDPGAAAPADPVPTDPASGEPDAAAPSDPEKLKICPRLGDLALCLRFEGQALDESAHLHPLTISNVEFQPGVTRLAGSFAAGGIAVPESSALDTPRLTIEAWINPRVLPAPGTQMGVVDNNGQWGMFLRPDGAVVCLGRGIVTAPGAAEVGKWHALACTFDEKALAIYVDGVKKAEVVSLGPLLGGGTTGTSVGHDNPLGSDYDGLLDNVRIWRIVRTPQQICGAAITCPP
jgi:hypothetical protein